jgi:hypothetical protein
MKVSEIDPHQVVPEDEEVILIFDKRMELHEATVQWIEGLKRLKIIHFNEFCESFIRFPVEHVTELHAQVGGAYHFTELTFPKLEKLSITKDASWELCECWLNFIKRHRSTLKEVYYRDGGSPHLYLADATKVFNFPGLEKLSILGLKHCEMSTLTNLKSLTTIYDPSLLKLVDSSTRLEHLCVQSIGDERLLSSFKGRSFECLELIPLNGVQILAIAKYARGPDRDVLGCIAKDLHAYGSFLDPDTEFEGFDEPRERKKIKID